MAEFGERVKQERESRGMTQQTLAEKLYVTRQAVSRWECGARYPDLLTAKKIANILEVSLDELLSGEEGKEKPEKGQVSARSAAHILQTALYAVTAAIYLLLCAFSLYSLFWQNTAASAGKISLAEVSTDVVRMACFLAAAAGFFLSAKAKLSAGMTGILMCVPYVGAVLSFLAAYADMRMNHNGYMGFSGWLTDFAVPLALAACILAFFGQKGRGVPVEVILGICILTIVSLVYIWQRKLSYTTELGFAVMTVSVAGKAGMAVLLGYQACMRSVKCVKLFQTVRGRQPGLTRSSGEM